MAFIGLSFSATKDVESNPAFKSGLVRWAWKVYSQRLTKAGRWFIWPTAILVGFSSMSLQMPAYMLFSYALAIWVVAVVAMIVSRPRVKLRAQHAQRVCAGETMPVDIEVEQAGLLRGADLFVLAHRLPEALDAMPDDGIALPALRRGEKSRVRMGLKCPKRGVYPMHGFRVETDFPFGLLRASRAFENNGQLVVYPRFARLARLTLPTGRRYHPGGVALASSLGESFEYIGNREYRDGDSIRDIDWRATARLSTPIVREYRDEYYLRVAVILDTHVPGGSKQVRRDDFERAVSVSAAVSDYMARQEYLVDIFAAGPNLYHLTAGRSLAYFDQILDILACVEENPAEPFDAIEPEILENLTKITTIICVFLDWNDARRAFVHRLARQGAGVKVIVVREGSCTIPPVADADMLGALPVVSRADFEAGIEEL